MIHVVQYTICNADVFGTAINRISGSTKELLGHFH